MAEFNWVIQNLERTPEEYITIAHWRCDGVNDTHSTGAYGTVAFNQEEGEEIIPFDQLTPEIVWPWVYEKLNKEEVEAAVQAKLDELANPPLISGLPWAE